MAKERLLIGLYPSDIGKVITVQSFRRSAAIPGEVIPNSLSKAVGRLQAYSSGEDMVRIMFEGGSYMDVKHDQYLEIIKEDV